MRPARSYTMVGAIDERGRLPGSTRFATGAPSTSGANEKSVSSLLSRKPPSVSRWLPNAHSIDDVIATALPAPSTIEMCVVAGKLQRLVHAPRRLAGGRRLRGYAGWRPPEAPVDANARRARAQIAAVEQPGRRRDEIRIRHVRGAIGEREPFRFAREMDAPERRGAHRRDVPRLEDAEHLEHGRTAGGRQRHPADLVRTIRAAHRLAHLHAVARRDPRA